MNIAGDIYHYTRDKQSTQKSGGLLIAPYGGRNSVDQATRLECHRPLIYEPVSWKQAMCSDHFGAQGNRKARQIPSTIISGSFRIRMSEGTNRVHGWVGGKELEFPDNETGMMAHYDQTVYDKDGFASTQFVRIMGIIVNDMGDGYGNFSGKNTSDVVQEDQPLSNHYAMGEGDGVTFQDSVLRLDQRWLLAPSMAQIFDGYWQDPAGDMTATPDDIGAGGDKWWRHEEITKLKYIKNTPTGTPNALTNSGTQGNNLQGESLHDPLRGDKRERNFHVFYDRTVAFLPRGTTSSSVNQDGARQHDMKWSVKIKGSRFPQDIRKIQEIEFANAVHNHEYNPTGTIDPSETTGVNNIPEGITTYPIVLDEATRTVEGANKRIFWYFMPSISTHVNGKFRGASQSGDDQAAVDSIGETIRASNLHHYFQVTRGPEKCFFIEKDDE